MQLAQEECAFLVESHETLKQVAGVLLQFAMRVRWHAAIPRYS